MAGPWTASRFNRRHRHHRIFRVVEECFTDEPIAGAQDGVPRFRRATITRERVNTHGRDRLAVARAIPRLTGPEIVAASILDLNVVAARRIQKRERFG